MPRRLIAGLVLVALAFGALIVASSDRTKRTTVPVIELEAPNPSPGDERQPEGVGERGQAKVSNDEARGGALDPSTQTPDRGAQPAPPPRPAPAGRDDDDDDEDDDEDDRGFDDD